MSSKVLAEELRKPVIRKIEKKTWCHDDEVPDIKDKEISQVHSNHTCLVEIMLLIKMETIMHKCF